MIRPSSPAWGNEIFKFGGGGRKAPEPRRVVWGRGLVPWLNDFVFDPTTARSLDLLVPTEVIIEENYQNNFLPTDLSRLNFPSKPFSSYSAVLTLVAAQFLIVPAFCTAVPNTQG